MLHSLPRTPRTVASPWCHINGNSPRLLSQRQNQGASEQELTHSQTFPAHLPQPSVARGTWDRVLTSQRHPCPNRGPSLSTTSMSVTPRIVLQAPTESAGSHFRSESNKSGFLACRGWNQHMRPLNIGQPTTRSSNSSPSDTVGNETIWSRNKNSKSCPESFPVRVKFLSIFSGSSERYRLVIKCLTTFAHLEKSAPLPAKRKICSHTREASSDYSSGYSFQEIKNVYCAKSKFREAGNYSSKKRSQRANV